MIRANHRVRVWSAFLALAAGILVTGFPVEARAATATTEQAVTVHVVDSDATPFAQGGGCSRKAYTNFGWISACISAIGFDLHPNVWVGITGNRGPGCVVRIRLMSDVGGVMSSANAPCTKGSHEGYIRTAIVGRFHTNGILANDADQFVGVDSPPLIQP